MTRSGMPQVMVAFALAITPAARAQPPMCAGEDLEAAAQENEYRQATCELVAEP